MIKLYILNDLSMLIGEEDLELGKVKECLSLSYTLEGKISFLPIGFPFNRKFLNISFEKIKDLISLKDFENKNQVIDAYNSVITQMKTGLISPKSSIIQ